MALVLDDLVIRLGDFRLTAELTVPRGARTAVLGPSGGGKSTLLAAIAGFVAPVAGRILWEGRDLTPLPPARRPLSILFQEGNLFPHLTARENVGLGLRPDLKLTAEEWDRVDAALARVGLGGLGNRLPDALSGGQRSRVALARALLRARPILLLDEPFAALGPALRAEMLELVAEIVAEKGSTLLMVTHDPGDARRICELSLLVADGRAHPPAPTERLLNAPPEALRRYLGPGSSAAEC